MKEKRRRHAILAGCGEPGHETFEIPIVRPMCNPQEGVCLYPRPLFGASVHSPSRASATALRGFDTQVCRGFGKHVVKELWTEPRVTSRKTLRIWVESRQPLA